MPDNGSFIILHAIGGGEHLIPPGQIRRADSLVIEGGTQVSLWNPGPKTILVSETPGEIYGLIRQTLRMVGAVHA